MGNFNPLAELAKRYPDVAKEPPTKALEYLSKPDNFRTVFPEYKDLGDADIVRNMKQYSVPRPSEAQQVSAGLPQPKAALPQGLQPTAPTEKVMVQSGAAGVPIGLDVPKGYGPAVEAASNKGVQTGAEIGSTVAPVLAGGVAALPAVGRGIIGSIGGAALGGYGGRELGGIVGQPELGRQIGATIGGLYGGYKGAQGINVPMGKMGFLESLFAKEPAELDPVEQAIKQKIASRIPLRLTKAQQDFLRAKVATPEAATAANRPLLPNTPLVGTPEEIAAYEQRMRILGQEAKDAGTYSAARGATSKKINYQQRIKGRMEK